MSALPLKAAAMQRLLNVILGWLHKANLLLQINEGPPTRRIKGRQPEN
jgi:hypothetical protein